MTCSRCGISPWEPTDCAMCDRLCPIFGTHGHLWDGDEDSSRDSFFRVREVETMNFDDVLSYAETEFLGRLRDVPKEDFLGLIHSDPKFQHLCDLLIYQSLIEDGQPITENRNRFVHLLRTLLVEGMSTEDHGCFLAVLLVAYQICFHPLNLEWFRNFPGCYLIASQPRWVVNFPAKEQAPRENYSSFVVGRGSSSVDPFPRAWR